MVRESQDFVDDLAVSRIPDRVRQQVVDWPRDAPRGAIREFCARHGVSLSWFHQVRARAAEEGNGAALKRSTRPHSSPTSSSDAVVAAVIAMRRMLVAEGKDHGPLSILDALDRADSSSVAVAFDDRADPGPGAPGGAQQAQAPQTLASVYSVGVSESALAVRWAGGHAVDG